MAEHGVLDILDRAKAPYELIPHEPTATAADEARELGLPADDVAKTIVVATRRGAVRAVLPASERLDLHKLRSVLAVRGKPRLATEDELARDYPEFELGAVPPIGGDHHDAVVVDRRLTAHEAIVLEAGSHRDSMRLRTSDLLLVADARVGDICCD